MEVNTQAFLMAVSVKPEEAIEEELLVLTVHLYKGLPLKERSTSLLSDGRELTEKTTLCCLCGRRLQSIHTNDKSQER
jgi:hypothetical protein